MSFFSEFNYNLNYWFVAFDMFPAVVTKWWRELNLLHVYIPGCTRPRNHVSRKSYPSLLSHSSILQLFSWDYGRIYICANSGFRVFPLTECRPVDSFSFWFLCSWLYLQKQARIRRVSVIFVIGKSLFTVGYFQKTSFSEAFSGLKSTESNIFLLGTRLITREMVSSSSAIGMKPAGCLWAHLLSALARRQRQWIPPKRC